MTSSITNRVEHRPWPLPSEPWVMFQRWHDLLFAHWPVPAESLRALVPPQLELDTRVGTAWLGITPFHMSNVRPRGFPALPWLSAFPELNVRTYVTVGGKAGVYFFSLDARNSLAVAGARFFFNLPYFHADMIVRKTGRAIFYSSRRTRTGESEVTFVARYEPEGEQFQARTGSIEHWLTERYCLYAVDRQRVYRTDIHHHPWPLQRARLELTANTMTAPLGLSLPAAPTHCHFARELDVVIWPPKRAD